MKIQLIAGKGKGKTLDTHCRKIVLVPQTEEEEGLLAPLATAIADGKLDAILGFANGLNSPLTGFEIESLCDADD